jgi:hypothetical protein
MLAQLIYQWRTSRARLALAGYKKNPSGSENLQEALAAIRSRSRKEKWFSWTSEQYQNDVVRFLVDHQQAGRGIIEVGCFRGGLSAQLAYVCQHYRWPFYTMDVDPAAVKGTSQLLNRLNLGSHSVVFQGSLRQFVAKTSLHQRPVAIIIDGDHDYEAVVNDIQSVYQLNHLPVGAAFHDYSLRHPTTDERVSDAIRDQFGEDVRVGKIGTQFNNQGGYPTKLSANPDGHYWETPGSEGAIVELPPRRRDGFAAQRPPRKVL